MPDLTAETADINQATRLQMPIPILCVLRGLCGENQ